VVSPVRSAPIERIADDDALRARYLDEVLDVLYPRSGSGATVDTEYLVVPHARRPRLLVPAHDRRLAATAVRRYSEPQSRMARLKRGATVAALRTGVWGALQRDRRLVTTAPGPDGGIDGYLRDALGADLHVSVHIGPARPSRKPVLQLFGPDESTLGYAKVGVTALTRALVGSEARALVALGHANLRLLRVPQVLHSGQWLDHEVLVTSPLPVWLPRTTFSEPRLASAMREVATCFGVRRATLGDSMYWQRLIGRLNALSETSEGPALMHAAERVAAKAGRMPLSFGAWHGDWAPWNMAMVADTILVWDWERFATGVPIGFDALHHALQRSIAAASPASPRNESGTAGAVVGALLDEAEELLLPQGVVGADAVEVIALLYLMDLAARYLADRQQDADGRLGVLATSLLPVLVDRVAAL
jgi:hypothetical protein